MTSTTDGAGIMAGESTVSELLSRRAQLQDWLGRLETLSDEVADRVVERVRADYRQRLEQVVEELASHVDTLRTELERSREELRSTGHRYEAAVDALEEARLRFRIGELDEAEWEATRPELEGEVEQTAAAREEARQEVGRLEELLAQIDAQEPKGFTPETDFAAPEAEVADVGSFAPQEEPEEEADTDDYAFLEELDRAIATAPGETSSSETSPPLQPGVKCPDCGYTNDPTAWYCGVCGVDLN